MFCQGSLSVGGIVGHSTHLCQEFPSAVRAVLEEDSHGGFHPIRENGLVHRAKGPLAHLTSEATCRLVKFPEEFNERDRSKCWSGVLLQRELW